MSSATTAARRASAAALTIFVVVLAAVAWGHDGTRVVQVQLLALPGIAWLLWPVASARLRRWRAILVAAWSTTFVADGVVRGHVLDGFGAAADSSLVISAVANTSARESSEFAAMYAPTIAVAGALLLAGVVVVAAAAFAPLRAEPGAVAPADPRRRLLVALVVVALLASAVGYASKPWRRWHPFAFWAGWVHEVASLRASLGDEARARNLAHERAGLIGTFRANDAPATVVFVLGESVNRDNLQIYGYPRATTPQLLSHAHRLEDALLVLRHAWSTEPGTLASLQSMLVMHEPEADGPMHLLALARAAGYRVWWISNHDDLGIERLHASMADEVRMLNRMPGRATSALDGGTLPTLAQALADPAPHKLIVLHLLGAHPHYRLRYPSEAGNPFAGRDDAVQAALAAHGRPAWLRTLRDEYDAALHYHDGVVARSLDMTRAGRRAGGYAAWIYVSDHGQEVAHEVDRAGHSETTAAGYRIPALIWQSAPRRPLPEGVAQRPFRADWVGWTLAHLLDVHWPGRSRTRDVLDAAYHWHPPKLRAPVRDFQR